MGLIDVMLAPVRGVVALGELIRRRADEEAANPAAVRRELEAVEEARAAGEISPEEEAETQQRMLNRLQVSRTDEEGGGERGGR